MASAVRRSATGHHASGICLVIIIARANAANQLSTQYGVVASSARTKRGNGGHSIDIVKLSIAGLSAHFFSGVLPVPPFGDIFFYLSSVIRARMRAERGIG